MHLSSPKIYSAFPATDVETGDASRQRYIDNLERELPLATQRRADKRKRYIDAMRAHIQAGNDPKQFGILHPQFHLPDPDTALLYCLFGKPSDVEYGASTLGVPESVLQLYCFIHEEKMHQQQVFVQNGVPIDAEESAERFGVEWISAIDPGDNLYLVPARLVHWLLSDPGIGMDGLAVNPELRLAVEHVAALHLRAIQRNSPTREEWKSVRRVLMEFADRAQSSSEFGEIDRLITQIAENSATDCADSNVIGEEIVMPIAQLHAQMQAPGLVYTAEEIALKEHIEKLRDAHSESLAGERARPEVKALYAKMNLHHSQVFALRAKMVGHIAARFIGMTRGVYANA
ncbi:hypothetical protein [Paraburkholderia sp. BCC1885]|uniref:hypothetical protein n=1 Tax=Paraburkholderia sp. BCC1885 TaxID=2562669 RepID=UPI0011843D84|nr:hypothetical protein [Paraburkholderia sp. BCC1885]